jgi:hypothetical protein
MKLNFDFDQVRVVFTGNRKGNPRVYLEVLGERVLYTDPWEMSRDDPWFAHYVTTTGVGGPPFTHYEHEVNTEELAHLFRMRLAHKMRDWLLEDPQVAAVWSTTTDREISHTPPRIEVVDQWD